MVRALVRLPRGVLVKDAVSRMVAVEAPGEVEWSGCHLTGRSPVTATHNHKCRARR